MSKPIAVISGDIHYSLSNLELADAATRMSIAKANELSVPFIANGDTHDSKANLRGECINAMIKTFNTAKIKPYVNIGNHCKINEKSEEHSLNFLKPYAHVIEKPTYIDALSLYIMPYHHDTRELIDSIKYIHKDYPIILHQGILGSNMGDYIQDKSALSPNDVAGKRIIASHYHARQTITLPDGGVWDYVGSPFTMSYGEANDPEKGFQILMDDGSLEFIPTNLRKHIVIETDDNFTAPNPLIVPKQNDLVWVKIRDTKEKLSKITRPMVMSWLGIDNFRLDLIPTDSVITASKSRLPEPELLDSLIDSTTETSDACKSRLKDKWRKYV